MAGAETSFEVEVFCRELAARCSSIEAELEAKRKEALLTAEQRSVLEQQVSAIDERIKLAQDRRLEALRTVLGFTQRSATEIKAMKNRPPPIVRKAIEAIYIVLNCRRWAPDGPEGHRGLDVAKEWNRIQRMLSNDGFVQSVLQFDVAVLEGAPNVAQHVAEKYFPGVLHEARTCSPSSPRGDAAVAESTSLPPVGVISSRRWPTSARAAGPLAPMEGVLPMASGASSSTAPAASAASAAAVAPAPKSFAASPRRERRRGASQVDTVTPRLSRSSVASRSSTEALHDEPLDIAAVEYASRACGAMVTWVWEVLREFFVLRELRLLRQAVLQQLEALGVWGRDEAIALLQEELAKLYEELESWRARVLELRAREAEAERARASLLKLSRLESRSSASPPPMKRPGRCAKLQPVIGSSAPSLDAWPPATPGRGGPVLRAVSIQAVQKTESRPKKPCAGTENAAWPPRGRKYLHIMSNPSLSMKSMVEEAVDRTDDWSSPSVPLVATGEPR